MKEKNVCLFLADGFEEGESLFVVDILRRAGIKCDIVSIKDKYVTSTHGIKVEADNLISNVSKDSYDMIVLPGGQPGANNLRDSNDVIEWVNYFNDNHKYIAAICAAPIVLQWAGIINGRKITSYPTEQYIKLFSDSLYQDEIVVVDDNIITSRGPATTLPFAYTLVDILGYDSAPLKEGMLYNYFLENKK